MAMREQRCPGGKANQDPEGQQEATHQSRFGPLLVKALPPTPRSPIPLNASERPQLSKLP